MEKRTSKEIEKDLRRIKKVAKTAISLKEISDNTDLSISKVRTTLEKHPTVFKRIKEQLEENKANVKKVAKVKPKPISKSKTKAKAKSYVIDASITGANTFKEYFSKMYESNSKIILTSITIDELEKMQKFNDTQGYYARRILNIAAENADKFLNVLIDETDDIADNCIIKYCAENKENVKLVSSDKTMVLKSRMYGVETIFLEQQNKHEEKIENIRNLVSLRPAKRFGNRLFIANKEEKNFFVRTYSQEIEFRNNLQELKAGDDVFIATNKDEYLSFAHYQILNNNTENNAKLVFSRRIYNKDEIESLDKRYKTFMKDFIYSIEKAS